jgi:hypothetical protein
MVAVTGTALRPDTLKLVNLPEVVQVEADAAGLPVALKGRPRQKIAAIDDHWRLDDEWWRGEPISRLYYVVRLVSGQRVVLFHDLVHDAWYSQTL